MVFRGFAIFGIICAALSVTAPSLAQAASQLYEMSGEVRAISKRTIVLRDGGEEFEFDRKGIKSTLPADLKAGDRVTVRYRMEAMRVRKNGEMPGEAATESPIPAVPIIDDRAFFPG
jgi:hypothetical protein